MSRRRVLLVVAAGFLLLAAVVWAGPLTRERPAVTSTAAPAPVEDASDLVVEPGETLCATRIVLGPRSEVAELHQRMDRDDELPPLTVTASGPGYRSAPAEVPGGESGRRQLLVPIDPPREELIGELCVRNDGDESARLLGTTELRTYTRLQTELDGEPVDADLTLAFYRAEPQSAVARLPVLVERMAALRGFVGFEPLVWLVLVAVLLGVPLLVLRALAGALRDM